jgi:hypothetical protein
MQTVYYLQFHISYFTRPTKNNLSKNGVTKYHSLSADFMQISQRQLTTTRFLEEDNSDEDDDELLSELRDKIT